LSGQDLRKGHLEGTGRLLPPCCEGEEGKWGEFLRNKIGRQMSRRLLRAISRRES